MLTSTTIFIFLFKFDRQAIIQLSLFSLTLHQQHPNPRWWQKLVSINCVSQLALNHDLFINKSFTVFSSRLRSALRSEELAAQKDLETTAHGRRRGDTDCIDLPSSWQWMASTRSRCKLSTALQLYFWQPPQYLANDARVSPADCRAN